MSEIRGMEAFALSCKVSGRNLMGYGGLAVSPGCECKAEGIARPCNISSLCGLIPFPVLHKIDFKDF